MHHSSLNPTLPTLEAASEAFLRAAAAKQRRPRTLVAYAVDLRQFVEWLRGTKVTVATPADITPLDVTECLAHLADRKLAGVTRARKVAALREWGRYLVVSGILATSPLAHANTPRREQRGRNYLTPEEYYRLLAAAGGHPRDYAILQVFLQTGVRVSELCALTIDDVGLRARTLRVREGKGLTDRTIELEKKGCQAIKSWLAVRPPSLSAHLFLNRDGNPLGERGVQKLLAKYVQAAGIAKRISPHSLRHTFASHKTRQGVSAFQLRDWLGHRKLDTTRIYVHLAKQDAARVMEATSL